MDNSEYYDLPAALPELPPKGNILYVQEVVTLQKKCSNIFASEN